MSTFSQPSLVAVLLAGSIGGVAPAVAQVPNSYDFDFVTIGAPGNRNTIPSEVPYVPKLEVGAVPYEYRLSRTEVAVAQWFEFVEAYVRWNPDEYDNTTLLGPFIGYRFDGSHYMTPGSVQVATASSWRFCARFCNWLHNNKADSPEAFEGGAYDTATFTENSDGTLNDQRDHAPGARYWIPTHDEWIKGAYYDPKRYGAGQEGYWMSPNTSDEILISGLPESGGETNAGWGIPSIHDPLTVGMYPGVQSPWGLLDVSGGQSEWTESINGSSLSRDRTFLGSRALSSTYFLEDRPDFFSGLAPTVFLQGLRLASTVPSPGTAVLLGLMSFFLTNRRFR